MDNQTLYMAYDGDNAGRLCGRAILADDPNALHEVSARIALGHEIVKKWVTEHGGQFISGGGDEGVFSMPSHAVANLEELRADYQFATNLTTTIGVGKTLSEAGKAMLVGKFRGKNTVVQYDESLEGEIRQAQDRTHQGTASAEEKKISEAYLEPEGKDMTKSEHDCPYCQEMDAAQIDDPTHCRYCHDAERETDPCPYCAEPHDPKAEGHSMDDCPYCQDAMANHDPASAGHPDDCPYCDQSQSVPDANGGTDQQVEPTAGPTIKNPTTTDSENYAGQDFNQPDLPKPDAIQQNPDGLGVTSDDGQTNENVKLDAQGQGGNNETHDQAVPQEDPQSDQTVEEIAQQIEQTPIEENPETQAVAQIDQPDVADTATGTRMEGATSRPEDYDEENAPQDMGLAEQDESVPDVTAVMQEGLDNHADSIQREKVVNLVSEALEGFKGCKGIIEKAKLQAPQLYESSIAMLRAMIEMCKMLGLDQETGGNPEDPMGGAQPQGPDNSNPADGGIPTYEQRNDAGAGESESATQVQGPHADIPQYEKRDEMDKGAGNTEEGPHSVKGHPDFTTGLPRRHENPKFSHMQAQAGVHKPASGAPMGEAAHRGPMGEQSGASKPAHRNVLSDLKRQPKPSLPKSEDMSVKK